MKIRRAATLAQLAADGYRPRSVREEMRGNLLRLLAGEGGTQTLFAGVLGYDETVLPEIENAVLSGHHMVLLGERGQAKSRLIRALVGLLDEAVPAVEGCEIHDDPFAPVCAPCRRRAAEQGGDLPVVWIGRQARYGEKLATPDVTIADLIGEIDPIKIAEGRYLSDEEAIHFGLLARTHRGIFAINELPDLTEKVQVGLFNVMEERDLQIKGYKIRLPLDVLVVATANPEDREPTQPQGLGVEQAGQVEDPLAQSDPDQPCGCLLEQDGGGKREDPGTSVTVQEDARSVPRVGTHISPREGEGEKDADDLGEGRQERRGR